jgi:hypothetical protein
MYDVSSCLETGLEPRSLVCITIVQIYHCANRMLESHQPRRWNRIVKFALFCSQRHGDIMSCSGVVFETLARWCHVGMFVSVKDQRKGPEIITCSGRASFMKL